MGREKWFAVYTRSRAEKKVLKNLQEAGISVYLPIIKTMRQWSDRKKKVELPLIPSYIFVKIQDKDYRKVLEVDGTVAFISFEGHRIPIPESQINALKGFIAAGMNVEATSKNVKKGDEVRIGSGPLKGTKGEVIEVGGKQKFVLRVDIGYTLIVSTQGVELIKV